MRKAGYLAIPLLAMVLVCLGCGGEGGGAKVYDQSSRTIKAKVGEEFTISLESNPTTGYSWQLSQPLDEDIVEFVQTDFILPPESEGMVGAGGTEEWLFKAAGKGRTTISLEYVRPWEEEEPAVETIDFDLTVD